MRRLALALALAACTSKPATPPAEKPAARPLPNDIKDLVGKPAPSFSLASVRDNTTITVPSKDVTVVTFFGRWSPTYRAALPALEELRKKHPGLRVVAVSIDEERPTDLAAEYAPVPIAWCGMGSATNAEWLAGPYGGEHKIFVLDRRGTIRYAHGGGKEYTVILTKDGRELVEKAARCRARS
jgi:hypothetical protein